MEKDSEFIQNEIEKELVEKISQLVQELFKEKFDSSDNKCKCTADDVKEYDNSKKDIGMFTLPSSTFYKFFGQDCSTNCPSDSSLTSKFTTLDSIEDLIKAMTEKKEDNSEKPSDDIYDSSISVYDALKKKLDIDKATKAVHDPDIWMYIKDIEFILKNITDFLKKSPNTVQIIKGDKTSLQICLPDEYNISDNPDKLVDTVQKIKDKIFEMFGFSTSWINFQKTQLSDDASALIGVTQDIIVNLEFDK